MRKKNLKDTFKIQAVRLKPSFFGALNLFFFWLFVSSSITLYRSVLFIV